MKKPVRIFTHFSFLLCMLDCFKMEDGKEGLHLDFVYGWQVRLT